jgi:hypothetical protein
VINAREQEKVNEVIRESRRGDLKRINKQSFG